MRVRVRVFFEDDTKTGFNRMNSHEARHRRAPLIFEDSESVSGDPRGVHRRQMTRLSKPRMRSKDARAAERSDSC